MRRDQRIKKYAASSSLMDICIKYGDETIKFNLTEELAINENKITSEITEQPTIYAFIAMLHKKLVRVANDKDKTSERSYAKAFINIKTSVDESTGRAHSKEVAKEKALLDIKYIKADKASSQAKEEADVVGVAVRAFEQRQSLIQTLSANMRKEQ